MIIPQLTAEDFVAWFNSQEPSRVVGVTCNSRECLVSNFYGDVTNRNLVVTYKISYYSTGESRDLQNWELYVASAFDELYPGNNKSIRAEDKKLCELVDSVVDFQKNNP